MNRLLFIVFAFIMFLQPLFAQGSHEDNMYIKRMREQYERRQKQQNNFQKPMDDSVLTLLGRWAWGGCSAVDIQGQYAYIGNGSLIHILDIQDPTKPVIIGEYLTNGYIDELDVRGSYLYASSNGYLIILDVSNPNNPVLNGSILTSGWRLAVSDSFAYALTWGCYLQIIDISNPANPYLRGGTSVVGYELPTNVTVLGKTVYANGYGGYGFSMVDVTDPDHPVNHYSETEKHITAIAADDTFLLVSTLDDSLLVYSIQNPLQPVELSRLYFEHGNPWVGMDIAKNILFATATGGGVYSIDISDPYNPYIRDYYNTYNLSHRYYKIRYSNGLLITSVISGILFIDAQNPDSLTQQSYFATVESYWKIKIKDNYAFIAGGNSGLWILDVSDPYHPKEISNVNTGSCAEDLVVDSNYVYVICRNDFVANDPIGLYIIDYSNINQPQIISYYRGIIRSFINGLYVANNITKFGNNIFLTQYLSFNDSILEIVDVQNPFLPFHLSVFNSNEYIPYDIAVKDTIIYLGTSGQGMRILLFSNNQIYDISNYFNGKNVWGLQQKDSLLYVDRIDSFFVFDITNPILPLQLGRVKRTYGSFSQIDLFVDNVYAYWCSDYMGMFNIENPYYPYEIPLQVDFDAHSVVAKNHIVYVITGDKGMITFRNNLIIDIKENPVPAINNFLLYPNYPNPFNSSTNIRLFIKNRGIIELDLFNVLGQKISTIFKGIKGCGFHEFYVNFNDLASGIYIVRLKTPWGKVSRKVLFVK